MDNTIRLEIVTPEATVYSEDVDMVTLPGVEGPAPESREPVSGCLLCRRMRRRTRRRPECRLITTIRSFEKP